ncbi:hypothetical protein DB88DRAFT_469887 [Papiliotrema laurentii]|uniref:WW domain-containing protein n=1 Tax=Papiliotrema laurentii TaxID=5418 RepID=A0AAD9FVT3_PAPLA|nr:hypothetical protein DB88DRAFT_469887 [Papiliotrema laurentii]
MAESSRQAAAGSKSPTPPPLPDEPLPAPLTGSIGEEGEAQPVDQPILSLGDDDDEEEEEQEGEGGKTDKGDGDEDDHTEGDKDAAHSKSKGKEKEAAPDMSGENQPWQAVWSPEQNAWYFWNTVTGEVTWTNPLQPNPASTPSTSTTDPTDPTFQPPLPQGPPPPKAEDAPRPVYNAIPDIDPDLAYLLPPDQRGIGGPSADGAVQFAQFNARSGKFTTGDVNYKFDALDEYNRQKRFNDHYFDVDAWQKQKDEEHAKRKRDAELGIERDSKITKKDMDRFRKKKAEQKWRKQAWLRD